MRNFPLKLTLIVLSALAASGCWMHWRSGYSHGPVPIGTAVVYIREAPPPVRRAVIPPRPVTSAVWIDGYWQWTGARYVWVDGFWDRSPPAGKGREPGRWIHTSRGWYWRPGSWR